MGLCFFIDFLIWGFSVFRYTWFCGIRAPGFYDFRILGFLFLWIYGFRIFTICVVCGFSVFRYLMIYGIRTHDFMVLGFQDLRVQVFGIYEFLDFRFLWIYGYRILLFQVFMVLGHQVAWIFWFSGFRIQGFSDLRRWRFMDLGFLRFQVFNVLCGLGLGFF